jgi:hypothetical protein
MNMRHLSVISRKERSGFPQGVGLLIERAELSVGRKFDMSTIGN